MRRRLLLSVALLLSAAACGDYFDPAAASVGDRTISFARVEKGLEEFRSTDRYKELAQQGDVEALERDFEQGYLAQLVRRLVLQPRAEELGIEITDQDVSQQIDVIKQDFPSEQAFQETLKEQALDEDALRLLVRDRLVEDALRQEVTAEVTPSEEELRFFYDENLDQFRQVEVSHILVADEQLARDIARRLQAATAKEIDDLFARLARRHSQDQASAPQGGDLGFVSAAQFVPEFAEAVKALQINRISDPVQTEFGFHVIRVTARRTLTFDEVRTQISAQLAGPTQDDAWNEWVRQAYADARVDINPRYGKLNPVTGLISNPGARDVPGAEAPLAPEQPGGAQTEPVPVQTGG